MVRLVDILLGGGGNEVLDYTPFPLPGRNTGMAATVRALTKGAGAFNHRVERPLDPSIWGFERSFPDSSIGWGSTPFWG